MGRKMKRWKREKERERLGVRDAGGECEMGGKKEGGGGW